MFFIGADLEVSKNEGEGWQNILNSSKVADTKAHIFKIPHHGSQNGYLKAVWDQLIDSNPIANMTPWNKGKCLPQLEMLKIYGSHSEKVYLTADPQKLNNKPKSREKGISKAICEKNPTLREIKFHNGIIRSRLDLIDNKWNVELFGEAFHVNSTILATKL